MNRSRNVVSRNQIIKPKQETADFGRTQDELLFWIDCLGAPVLVVERHDPTIILANTTAASFFVVDPDEFKRSTLGDVLGGEAEQLLGQVWSRGTVGAVGEPFIIRSVVDGQSRLLMVRATNMLVEGELLRLFTFTDAPPQGSVTLAGWQDNMMEILNWFPFGFEVADNADQVQFANAQCKRLFGYGQHQLECAEDWWALAYPDPQYRRYARTKWEMEIAAARSNDREIMPFDLDVTTASGEVRTIQFRHRTIGSFNVNLFLDVTRERAYERELKLLAGTDSLTGAMNRRRFFEEASLVFGREASLPAALLMLDIDHFKKVNDIHGHGAGDLVLREVTRRCGLVLTGIDKFARFGGEEFAVLLPETELDEAKKAGERLCAIIRDLPIKLPDSDIQITASVGATICIATDTIDAAIFRADKALYDAKHLGRNRVAVSSFSGN